MNLESPFLLDQYIAAIKGYLVAATDPSERSDAFERLAIADQMRTEIEKGNLGAAFAILSSEQRVIGWGGFYGIGGTAVHDAFQSYAKTLKAERLNGLPDAGFGH